MARRRFEPVTRFGAKPLALLVAALSSGHPQPRRATHERKQSGAAEAPLRNEAKMNCSIGERSDRAHIKKVLRGIYE